MTHDSSDTGVTVNADMTPDDGERRHLPECSESMIPDFHNERWICICAALRACEQRVREEWYEAQSDAWEQGYMNGLKKAVQIIKDQPTKRQEYWVYIRRNETLDAINALCLPPLPTAHYDPAAKDNRP